MTHSVHANSAQQAGAPLVANNETVTFGNVFISEWRKLWWLRSVKWSASILIVLSWVTAVFIGFLLRDDFYPLISPESALVPGQLIAQNAASGWIFLSVPMALIGIFAITSEFGSGMMRSTVNAVPHRDLLFGAKVLSLTLSVLLVAAITVLSTAAISAVVIAGERFTWLFSLEVLLSLSITVLTLVAVTLCATFVGWLVRNSSAAITLVLSVLFLLPTLFGILMVLNYEWVQWLMALFPSSLSVMLINLPFGTSSADFPSGLFGSFGLIGWLAVLGISAWLVQRKRAVR